MFLSVPVIAVIKLVLTDYIEYKNRIKDRKERAMKKGSLEIKEENSKIK